MTTQLTFNNMQAVAQKIFGMNILRSGSRFQLRKGDTLLGEGHGTQYTLKGVHNLFQSYLDHPEVVDLLSPELQEALGQDKAKNQEARAAASRIGVSLVREKGGFLLFKDGEQLGNDLEQVWSAEEIIDYCQKFEQGMKTAVYVV